MSTSVQRVESHTRVALGSVALLLIVAMAFSAGPGLGLRQEAMAFGELLRAEQGSRVAATVSRVVQRLEQRRQREKPGVDARVVAFGRAGDLGTGGELDRGVGRGEVFGLGVMRDAGLLSLPPPMVGA